MWWLYFAIHDVKTHRIEPKARLLFLPYALLSLWPSTLTHQNSIGKALTDSLIGAVGAFLLLFFISAICAPKKAERGAIGGGDIKLFLYVGFIYGSVGTLGVLFFMSFTALFCQLIFHKKKGEKALAPFIGAGCVFVSVLQFIMM